MHSLNSGTHQRGVFLIEALIALLIFAIGILALVAIQARAITAQSDAEFRIEAANYADQMMNQIWLNVNRSTPAQLQTTLLTFVHQPNTAGTCTFTGNPSTNVLVTTWAAAVSATAGLPRSTQQILVDTANYNLVTITLCWQGPQDPVPHRHTVTGFIN